MKPLRILAAVDGVMAAGALNWRHGYLLRFSRSSSHRAILACLPAQSAALGRAAFHGAQDPGVRLGGNAPGRERVGRQWGLIRGLGKSAKPADSTGAACFEEVAGLKCATPVELIEAGLKE